MVHDYSVVFEVLFFVLRGCRLMFGVWGLVYGVWGLVYGVWGLVYGVWGLVFAVWWCQGSFS